MAETILVGLIVGITANLITHYVLYNFFPKIPEGENLKILDYLEVLAWNILPIIYVFIGLFFMPILAIKLVWKILFLSGIFILPFIILVFLNIGLIKTWICSLTTWEDYANKRFQLSYLFLGLIFGIILFQ